MQRYSEQAERAILATALAGSGITSELLTSVPDHAFYAARHQVIWGACRSVFSAGALPDLISVRDLLIRMGTLEHVGGDGYLMEIATEFVSDAGVEMYGKIVNDHFVARSAIVAARALSQEAEDGANAEELVQSIAQASGRLTEASRPKGTTTGNPASVLGSILNSKLPERVLTGLNFWDDKLMMRKGNLIYLAGATGLGKSTLAANIAGRVARTGRVLYNPLEMSIEEMTEMLIAMRTRIKRDRVANHQLSEKEMALAREKVLEISNNLRIIQSSTLPAFAAQAKAMKHNGGLDLAFVDTVMLMQGPGKDETERISKISSGLKILASELECPIIGLCQFSRETMKSGRRPTIYDLKGSSSLEQDANAIIIMHQEMDANPNDIELYFDKIRGQQTARSTAGVDKSISLFYDP